MALMAAGSYWDIRDANAADPNKSNRAPLPQGWQVLTQYDTSGSGPNANLLSGFSARVYKGPGGQIVISYAGTEIGSSALGTAADFLSGNIPLAAGSASSQALAAAQLYQQVKAEQSGNITFTGHSLGGGLASVMAVWFNRPAYVFAPAPFQNSADATQATTLPDILSLNRALPNVRFQLGSMADLALLNYNPATDFASREANVKAYAVKGELLEALLGGLNWIEGSSTPLYNNPVNALDKGDKHSIDLHVAALITPNFETQANKLPTALQRLYDDQLYGYKVTSNQQNIMLKLIRNEVGVRDDTGTTVLLAANGMLTHFSEDLQKLGTNITGLTTKAQDAIIAQSIEWYYWQGTGYAGQNFFINNAQAGLLQYTSAVGAALPGALNKATTYAQQWLSDVYTANGGTVGTTFPPFGTLHDQWNVATSATGVTATARDANKNQIFIGGTGADTFTAGNAGDVILGGDGADTLNSGAGFDLLYGGTGFDTYQFDGAFGNDTLLDADGSGQIKLGSTILTGGKRMAEGLWESDDKTILYTQRGSDLAISQRSASASTGINGTITVKNWDFGQTGNQGTTQLGITLDGAATPLAPPVPATTYDLSTRAVAYAVLAADTPNSTSNLLIQNAGAALNWGTPGQPALSSSSVRSGAGADVIEGGSLNAVSNVVFAGGAGNDQIYANTTITLADAIARGDNPATVALDSSRYALDGGAGADQIIGSDARDVIFGGAGDDTIVGGAGGDIIIADGNVGGGLKVGSFVAPLTQGFIVDGPATSVGNTATLRTDHTGIAVGYTPTNSTGGRTRLDASPGTQYLNPLYSADFSALQSLNDTDIRGQGYSYDGTALTPDQPLGERVSYLGSSIVGAMTTNKDSSNDVIYAGAGDDVVNAINIIATYEDVERATARFCCENRRHRAQKQQFQRSAGHSSVKTSYASPVRLAGQKRLGRLMDSAQTASTAK